MTLAFEFLSTQAERPARLRYVSLSVVYVKLCNFRFMAEGVIG